MIPGLPRQFKEMVTEAAGSTKPESARFEAPGDAVAGALCTLEGTGRQVVTDGSGAFQFTEVQAGTYIVICRKTESSGEVHAFLRVVEVVGGASVDLGTVAIEPTGSLVGNITLDGQSDHAGILVFFAGTSIQALTDSAGNYHLENVPAGVHEVRFEKNGYNPLKSEVEVEPGQTVSTGLLMLNISTDATGGINLENGKVHSKSRTVTVFINASNDATLMKFSEDPLFIGAAWLPIAPTTTWTFSLDGEKKLYAKFVNANGLETSPMVDSIIIDTVSPLLEAKIDATATFVTIECKEGDRFTPLHSAANRGYVDFGLTENYESRKSCFGSDRATFSGLSPETAYHMRVTLSDAAENTSVSSDLTFTTPPKFKTIASGETSTCGVSLSDALWLKYSPISRQKNGLFKVH